MNSSAKHWVIVARILRPRGNKGEVAAELLTDYSERLTHLKEVYLAARDEAADGQPRPTAVRSCWLSQNHKGQAVFHFEGCSSIGEAEKLRGLEVLLPIEKRVKLEAGHYFVDDLIGCSVFEAREGPAVVASSPCSMGTAPTMLGVVRDVQFTGEEVSGTPILSVDTHGGELLIPLAEDICRCIDTVSRRIDVVLPEGLRELNEKQ